MGCADTPNIYKSKPDTVVLLKGTNKVSASLEHRMKDSYSKLDPRRNWVRGLP